MSRPATIGGRVVLPDRVEGVERSVLVTAAVSAAGPPAGVDESPISGQVELLPWGRLTLMAHRISPAPQPPSWSASAAPRRT